MNIPKTIEESKEKNPNQGNADLFLIIQPNMFIDSGNIKRIEEKIAQVQIVLEDIIKRALASGAKVATLVATNDEDVLEQGFTGDFNKIKESTKFNYGIYSSFLPCANARKIISSSQKPVVTLLITDGWLFNTDEAAVTLENYAQAGNNHLVIIALNHPNADLGILPHDKILLERLEDIGAEVYRLDNLINLASTLESVVKEKWVVTGEEQIAAIATEKSDSSVYVSKLLNTLLEVALQVTGVDCGSIMTLDKSSNKLMIKASQGLKEENLKDVSVKLGEGIAGLVAQEKHSLFLDDNKTEDVRIKNRLNKPWIKSSIVVPLQMGLEGDSFGVMNISSTKESIKLTPENAQLLEKLAKLVGIAVEKSGWNKV